MLRFRCLPRFDSSFLWYTTSLQLHRDCFSSITVSLDRSCMFVYCKIVCNLFVYACIPYFCTLFCSHFVFFSGEIFRRIFEACNTFGFICCIERNFIAFERILFLSGRLKKRWEVFNYSKIIKNFEMEKMDTSIGKECIKLLSSCKVEFCFLKVINNFQNF